MIISIKEKNPRKASNDKRIAAENELAQRLGFPTWRRLTTAAIKGDVILSITNPLSITRPLFYKTKKDDANA